MGTKEYFNGGHFGIRCISIQFNGKFISIQFINNEIFSSDGIPMGCYAYPFHYTLQQGLPGIYK